MVVVGVDAHERTHALVAIDEAGRKLAEKTVAATPDGHLEAMVWARCWPDHVFSTSARSDLLPSSMNRNLTLLPSSANPPKGRLPNNPSSHQSRGGSLTWMFSGGASWNRTSDLSIISAAL
jgi:hypothetical protein